MHDSPDYNSRADDFVREIQRHENEDPIERAGRHAMEGRVQYATVTAVADLASALSRVASAQTDAARVQAENRVILDKVSTDTTEMRGWLIGKPSNSGIMEPGLIQRVGVLTAAWRWVLALLSATAFSSAALAVHAWFK